MTHSSCIERLEQRYLLAAQAPGWSDTIDNPYFPLLVGSVYVYTGVKEGEAQVDRVIVTDVTKQIMGVTCTAVLDRVFQGGELTEKTYDFYAQDQAGNVWYFGENSQELENGKVVSREGSWEAGVNGATPGIIMEAHPQVGDFYIQEHAAGVAEDQAEVIALNGHVKTGFATFNNCLLTNESSPLEPGVSEPKAYAAGIGEIKEGSVAEGETLKLKSYQVGAAGFSDTIDNPFMPLLVGSVATYKGRESGEAVKDVVIVTDQTKVVMGVTTRLVFDRVFTSGELSEKTYDFFAQDKAGNVWYFGENSQEIENGKVVSREGSWEAGVNGALPGIVMLAQPGVGDAYQQEFATGVAEDQAKVLSLSESVKTPFGSFGKALQTREFTALEPGAVEDKFYARGIGVVKTQSVLGDPEVLSLVSYIA
jgi:hypothetical protein